jgi:hypothetical protein
LDIEDNIIKHFSSNKDVILKIKEELNVTIKDGIREGLIEAMDEVMDRVDSSTQTYLDGLTVGRSIEVVNFLRKNLPKDQQDIIIDGVVKMVPTITD